MDIFHLLFYSILQSFNPSGIQSFNHY